VYKIYPKKTKIEKQRRPDLVNSKTGVNSGTIDLFTLNIQPPYRRPHSLGAHSNHTDVLGKILA